MPTPTQLRVQKILSISHRECDLDTRDSGADYLARIAEEFHVSLEQLRASVEGDARAIPACVTDRIDRECRLGEWVDSHPADEGPLPQSFV